MNPNVQSRRRLLFRAGCDASASTTGGLCRIMSSTKLVETQITTICAKWQQVVLFCIVSLFFRIYSELFIVIHSYFSHIFFYGAFAVPAWFVISSVMRFHSVLGGAGRPRTVFIVEHPAMRTATHLRISYIPGLSSVGSHFGSSSGAARALRNLVLCRRQTKYAMQVWSFESWFQPWDVGAKAVLHNR